MLALIETLYAILDLYQWVLIIAAVMSWLVAFNIVNPYNDFVRIIGRITYALTEPLLRPIRQIVPAIGGIDLSFLVLWFAIFFLKRLLVTSIAPALLSIG